MQAIIFTGIQASGKSTFYRDRFLNTHIRLNLDMLQTRTREAILFNACLQAKQAFVIDNTNPTPKDRARYIEAAHTANFSLVAYYFIPDLSGCLARNSSRSQSQRVPPVAIYNAFKRLEPPTFAEGFNEIYNVSIGPDSIFLVEPAATA